MAAVARVGQSIDKRDNFIRILPFENKKIPVQKLPQNVTKKQSIKCQVFHYLTTVILGSGRAPARCNLSGWVLPDKVMINLTWEIFDRNSGSAEHRNGFKANALSVFIQYAVQADKTHCCIILWCAIVWFCFRVDLTGLNQPLFCKKAQHDYFTP